MRCRPGVGAFSGPITPPTTASAVNLVRIFCQVRRARSIDVGAYDHAFDACPRGLANGCGVGYLPRAGTVLILDRREPALLRAAATEHCRQREAPMRWSAEHRAAY
jgi:hypothetical protein